MQKTAPVVLAYFPAAHSSQVARELVPLLPAGHGGHVAPEYPSSLWYRPAGQKVHAFSSETKCPAEHVVKQAVAESEPSDEVWPAGQFVQLVERWSLTGWYLPGGQSMHEPLPELGWYCPALQ